MITGSQIRAARTALRWNVDTLSSKSQVSIRTIKRIETEQGVPNSTAANVAAIKTALETAGIEFIGTPDDRPGIRIGLPKPNDGSS